MPPFCNTHINNITMPSKYKQSSQPLPYDRKGRCRQHPEIQFRKRGTFGIGWTTLRLRCPLCVLSCSEVTTETASTVDNDDYKVSCSELSSSTSSTATSCTALPEGDDVRPCQSSVPTTVHMSAAHPSEEREGIACGMPYSYQHQSITYPGFYTGQIKCGKPHGVGTWRGCHGGCRIEGKWYYKFNIAGSKYVVCKKNPATSTSSSSRSDSTSPRRLSQEYESKWRNVVLPSVHEEEEEETDIDFDDESMSMDSLEKTWEDFVSKDSKDDILSSTISFSRSSDQNVLDVSTTSTLDDSYKNSSPPAA